MRLGLVLTFVGGIGAFLADSETVHKCYRCTSSDDYPDKPADIKNLGIQCANEPEKTEPFEVQHASPTAVVCKIRFIQGPNHDEVIVERSYIFMDDPPEQLADFGECYLNVGSAHVLQVCYCTGCLCNNYNGEEWSQKWKRWGNNLTAKTLTGGPQKEKTNSEKSSAQKPEAKSSSDILKLNPVLYICLEILIAFIVIV